jgi:hypothetical protein
MGKASRTKQSVSRQERIAAQRAAARQAEQRKRIFMAVGSVLAVIVVVAVFIIVKTTSGSNGTSASSGPTGTSLSSVVSTTTSVSAATLDSVAVGAVTAKPQTITGNATELTENARPEILYMGAEYCPYCAAERWGLIVALSRFGTFSGLATTSSSSSDVYKNTPTWTFRNAKYTSSYVSFTSVEMQDRNQKTLQTPTTAENAILTKYDAPPYVTSANKGAIPFIDFGNKYVIVGSSYSPQTIDGLTWSQIATDLHSPASAVGKAIDGTANYITASICKLTGNQPANVCTTTIKSLESQI